MAIREILDTEFEQECEHCGDIHSVADSDATVGLERDGQLDTKVVTLPSCPNCGSQEFLLRSGDDEPEHPSPGSFGHRHRLMVDVLHSKLVKAGRVATGIDPTAAQGKERTPEELTRWFKGRMRVRRRKESDGPRPEDKPIEPEGEQ
jgi:hypothetical protein